MRFGRVAIQWTTVLVLLALLALINHLYPELTGFEVGPQHTEPRNGQGGNYLAIDGDSFRAGQTEVRLHGIDAPEYRQVCDGNPCGRLARDALSTLLRGRNVSCKVLEQDRYGRQVSICRSGETDINREIVRLGWAVAYRRHSLRYVSAENEARKAKRGIWAWSFERPEDYRNRNRAVEGSLIGGDD